MRNGWCTRSVDGLLDDDRGRVRLWHSWRSQARAASVGRVRGVCSPHSVRVRNICSCSLRSHDAPPSVCGSCGRYARRCSTPYVRGGWYTEGRWGRYSRSRCARHGPREYLAPFVVRVREETPYGVEQVRDGWRVRRGRRGCGRSRERSVLGRRRHVCERLRECRERFGE